MTTTTERIIDTNEQIACALIANTRVNHRDLALWIQQIVSDPSFTGRNETCDRIARGQNVPLVPEYDAEPSDLDDVTEMHRYDEAVARLADAVVYHRQGVAYYSDPFRIQSRYFGGYADALQPTGLAFAITAYVESRSESAAREIMTLQDRLS